MDAEINQLATVVQQQHGGIATLSQSVPVRESFEGKPVWEGVVHIFHLSGHPKAKTAYAWSAATDGSTKRRYYTVLGIPPVNSPRDAVRAAIIQEYRTAKK